jgi:hypothetical protein
MIECFRVEEVARTLASSPGGSGRA